MNFETEQLIISSSFLSHNQLFCLSVEFLYFEREKESIQYIQHVTLHQEQKKKQRKENPMIFLLLHAQLLALVAGIDAMPWSMGLLPLSSEHNHSRLVSVLSEMLSGLADMGHFRSFCWMPWMYISLHTKMCKLKKYQHAGTFCCFSPFFLISSELYSE